MLSCVAGAGVIVVSFANGNTALLIKSYHKTENESKKEDEVERWPENHLQISILIFLSKIVFCSLSLSLLVAGNLAAVDDALVVSHLKKVTEIWKEKDIRYNKHWL